MKKKIHYSLFLLGIFIAFTGCQDNPSEDNTAPVADAGTDRTVTVGKTVQLDGSKSSDEDGDTLTYSWTITSAPEGSSAARK